MKLVMLIAAAMTSILMIIHILDERYKRKRIAEIAEKFLLRMLLKDWRK